MAPVCVKSDVSLKPYNTFGIDAKAKFFIEVTSLTELKEILADPLFHSEPKLILGGGSNMLLTQDYPGLVIKISLKGIEQIGESGEYVWVKAGAGEVWHSFVLHCIDNEWAGVENLSLIPGTVGAAPMQNIGAYGVEIKEVFESLEAYHLQTGEVHLFTNEQCKFGYRESVFKNEVKGEYIILNVTFRLRKHPEFNVSYGAIQDTLKDMGVENLSIQAISKAVIKIRSSKLPNPAEIGNAGSFFKNPTIPKAQFEELKLKYPQIPSYPVDNDMIKVPAGWLIEQCGWKGKRFGETGVHKNQALVLVNYGNANGADVKKLAFDIQHSVKTTFGIEISPEVNFI